MSIFSGLKYYVIDTADNKVCEILRDNEAIQHWVLSLSLRFVISDAGVSEDIDEAQDIYDKPVVTSEWVYSSLKANKLLPERLFHPRFKGLFKGFKFTLSEISLEDRKNITGYITIQKGSVLPSFTQETTHLVLGKAKVEKFTIVTPDWIKKCLDDNSLVPPEEFHPDFLRKPQALKPKPSKSEVTELPELKTQPRIPPLTLKNIGGVALRPNRPFQPQITTMMPQMSHSSVIISGGTNVAAASNTSAQQLIMEYSPLSGLSLSDKGKGGKTAQGGHYAPKKTGTTKSKGSKIKSKQQEENMNEEEKDAIVARNVQNILSSTGSWKKDSSDINNVSQPQQSVAMSLPGVVVTNISSPTVTSITTGPSSVVPIVSCGPGPPVSSTNCLTSFTSQTGMMTVSTNQSAQQAQTPKKKSSKSACNSNNSIAKTNATPSKTKTQNPQQIQQNIPQLQQHPGNQTSLYHPQTQTPHNQTHGIQDTTMYQHHQHQQQQQGLPVQNLQNLSIPNSQSMTPQGQPASSMSIYPNVVTTQSQMPMSGVGMLNSNLEGNRFRSSLHPTHQYSGMMAPQQQAMMVRQQQIYTSDSSQKQQINVPQHLLINQGTMGHEIAQNENQTNIMPNQKQDLNYRYPPPQHPGTIGSMPQQPNMIVEVQGSNSNQGYSNLASQQAHKYDMMYGMRQMQQQYTSESQQVQVQQQTMVRGQSIDVSSSGQIDSQQMSLQQQLANRQLASPTTSQLTPGKFPQGMPSNPVGIHSNNPGSYATQEQYMRWQQQQQHQYLSQGNAMGQQHPIMQMNPQNVQPQSKMVRTGMTQGNMNPSNQQGQVQFSSRSPISSGMMMPSQVQNMMYSQQGQSQSMSTGSMMISPSSSGISPSPLPSAATTPSPGSQNIFGPGSQYYPSATPSPPVPRSSPQQVHPLRPQMPHSQQPRAPIPPTGYQPAQGSQQNILRHTQQMIRPQTTAQMGPQTPVNTNNQAYVMHSPQQKLIHQQNLGQYPQGQPMQTGQNRFAYSMPGGSQTSSDIVYSGNAGQTVATLMVSHDGQQPVTSISGPGTTVLYRQLSSGVQPQQPIRMPQCTMHNPLSTQYTQPNVYPQQAQPMQASSHHSPVTNNGPNVPANMHQESIIQHQQQSPHNVISGGHQGLLLQQPHFYGIVGEPQLTDPRDILVGCVIMLVGYESVSVEEKRAWKRIIKSHGAQIVDTYDRNKVTHLLVDWQLSDPHLFKMALRDRKRVITIYWINDVLTKQKLSPPWQILHLPSTFSPDCTFSFISQQNVSMTGFDGRERVCVEALIRQIGARYSDHLYQTCTLLVCKKPQTKKYEAAKDWGIPCVNARWLQDLYLGDLATLSADLPHQYMSLEPRDVSLNIDFHSTRVLELMIGWQTPIQITPEIYANITRQRNQFEAEMQLETSKENIPSESSDKVKSETVDDLSSLNPLSAIEIQTAEKSKLRSEVLLYEARLNEKFKRIRARELLQRQSSIASNSSTNEDDKESILSKMEELAESDVIKTDNVISSNPLNEEGEIESTIKGAAMEQELCSVANTDNQSEEKQQEFLEQRDEQNASYITSIKQEDSEINFKSQFQKQDREDIKFDLVEQIKTPEPSEVTVDESIRITFTGMSIAMRQELTALLKKRSLGSASVNFVNSAQEATHVVASRLIRVPKVYHALALGIWVVSEKWILASLRRGEWIDESDWILNDPVNEMQLGVELSQSILKSRQRFLECRPGLFSGLEFFVTNNARHRDVCLNLIKECGGFVRDKRPIQRKALLPEPQHLIVCHEDEAESVAYYLNRLKNNNRAVHHEEFILSGVLRQVVDYDSYQIRYVSSIQTELNAALASTEMKVNKISKNATVVSPIQKQHIPNSNLNVNITSKIPIEALHSHSVTTPMQVPRIQKHPRPPSLDATAQNFAPAKIAKVLSSPSTNAHLPTPQTSEAPSSQLDQLLTANWIPPPPGSIELSQMIKKKSQTALPPAMLPLTQDPLVNKVVHTPENGSLIPTGIPDQDLGPNVENELSKSVQIENGSL